MPDRKPRQPKPLTDAQHQALRALWHHGPLERHHSRDRSAWRDPAGTIHTAIAVSHLLQRRMAKRTPDNTQVQITYTGLDYLKAKGELSL